MSVSLKIENGIGFLLIEREEALNALNMNVLQSLRESLKSIDTKGYDQIQVLVLKGAGQKAFVAGADIKLMKESTNDVRREFIELGQEVMCLLESLKIPTIASVPGFALGGGMELALACDIIIASDKGKFGQPEVNLGLIPGFGGTQRLPRRVGIGNAKMMIFTGDIVDARRALEMGLIDDLCEPDDLDARVIEIAEVIRSKGPHALACAKEVMQQPSSAMLTEGLNSEVEAFLQLFELEDTQEGLAAFVEKRKAEFKGK